MIDSTSLSQQLSFPRLPRSKQHSEYVPSLLRRADSLAPLKTFLGHQHCDTIYGQRRTPGCNAETQRLLETRASSLSKGSTEILSDILMGNMYYDQKNGVDVLPVVVVSCALCYLSAKIDKVACEKEIVLRRHGHRVPHESGGVYGESCCEAA